MLVTAEIVTRPRNPSTASGPAGKPDLTSQLLTRFKQLISQGELQPGMKLPPERELAPKFGVSRSSLRHALKVMETMGVVKQRVGDGTYLATTVTRSFNEPLEFLMLLDGTSASDLLDTRLIVEPEIAALAAQRASQDQIAELLECVASMDIQSDPAKSVEIDLRFHEVLFRASGVRLLERMFGIIHRAMAGSMAVTQPLEPPARRPEIHRRIGEAVAAHDAPQARAAMHEHLMDTRKLLEQAAVETGEPPAVVWALNGSQSGSVRKRTSGA